MTDPDLNLLLTQTRVLWGTDAHGRRREPPLAAVAVSATGHEVLLRPDLDDDLAGSLAHILGSWAASLPAAELRLALESALPLLIPSGITAVVRGGPSFLTGAAATPPAAVGGALAYSSVAADVHRMAGLKAPGWAAGPAGAVGSGGDAVPGGARVADGLDGAARDEAAAGPGAGAGRDGEAGPGGGVGRDGGVGRGGGVGRDGEAGPGGGVGLGYGPVWDELLAGTLGPWVMLTHGGEVVSVCHTARETPSGAVAAPWTAPGHRGRGHAATAVAAWSGLLRERDARPLFYRAADTDLSAQRVAARLALRPLGWLWSIRAR